MTDRMPPIPRDQWTEAQAKAAAEFARMRGQDVFGPFAVMLRSPEVMLRAGAMGDYMRYKTSLPPALNEMIILLTARHWSQQFEWHIHQPMALKAGLSASIVAAVSTSSRRSAWTLSAFRKSSWDTCLPASRRWRTGPVYCSGVASSVGWWYANASYGAIFKYTLEIVCACLNS